MEQICYVNGRYLNSIYANVNINDRGYQFSDGIYEVILVKEAILVNFEQHMERLKRSLAAIEINHTISDQTLKLIAEELIRRNIRSEGIIYIQITRGVAKRKHEFPAKPTLPSLVMTYSNFKIPSDQQYAEGVSVITSYDPRWQRRDIKSISLLGNVLCKQKAVEAKATECWLYNEQKFVTEGSTSNSYIVTKNNVVMTHPADFNILGGVTRKILLDLMRRHGIEVLEQAFSLNEAYNAKEAFLTNTTSGVLPINMIDKQQIGTGKAGEITVKLIELYRSHITNYVNVKRAL